jgi:hypothetical protein
MEMQQLFPFTLLSSHKVFRAGLNENQYQILWVCECVSVWVCECVCILVFAIRLTDLIFSAHFVLSSVVCLLYQFSFSRDLINGTIFEKKIEHKSFDFLHKFCLENFLF